jgi:DNA modification methylase
MTKNFPSNLARLSKVKPVTKDGSVLICADSRRVLDQLPENLVNTTVTSPPYGDLKNYGRVRQIGFGQSLGDEYLSDIQIVLKSLFRVTKTGGALWLVLDMLRSSGHTIALPWEVIDRARQAGWTFQDTIVWDKGRSNRGKGNRRSFSLLGQVS